MIFLVKSRTEEEKNTHARIIVKPNIIVSRRYAQDYKYCDLYYAGNVPKRILPIPTNLYSFRIYRGTYNNIIKIEIRSR